MSRKPILSLDFDGVIHSYTSGWKGATVIPDPPTPGAKEFLEEAVKHFSVYVFSSRMSTPEGTQAIMKWMYAHFGDITDRIRFPANKPPATVSLDDRAVTFTGEWPDVQALLQFRPWNKRG